LIVARKKIIETANDKHNEKSETSGIGDNLEKIIEKTFESLDGGDVGVGDTTAGPSGLGKGCFGESEGNEG